MPAWALFVTVLPVTLQPFFASLSMMAWLLEPLTVFPETVAFGTQEDGQTRESAQLRGVDRDRVFT